jgi:hypothetical protein
MGGPHPVIPKATNNPANNNSTDPAVPGVTGTTLQTILNVVNPGPGSGVGVFGNGEVGVQGTSDTGRGVFGQSNAFDAVVGESASPANAGVTGRNTSQNPGPNAVGIYGDGGRSGNAGKFDGHVQINGTAHVTGEFHCAGNIFALADVLLGQDCAEDFEIAPFSATEPGTVMVLDSNGALRPSERDYDKKVAGVISGAGDYKPGLILGRCESSGKRLPLALVGKVYCKVDAQYASVEVGDLLTTSPTPGHAMRAMDPLKSFGAVLGKALRRLDAGQGLIPILVALQ